MTFACEQDGFLREGCLLVPCEDKPAEVRMVTSQGKREPVSLGSEHALEYASIVAAEFGIGDDWTVTFDRYTAKASMDKRGEKRASKTKAEK